MVKIPYLATQMISTTSIPIQYKRLPRELSLTALQAAPRSWMRCSSLRTANGEVTETPKIKQPNHMLISCIATLRYKIKKAHANITITISYYYIEKLCSTNARHKATRIQKQTPQREITKRLGIHRNEISCWPCPWWGGTLIGILGTRTTGWLPKAAKGSKTGSGLEY